MRTDPWIPFPALRAAGDDTEVWERPGPERWTATTAVIPGRSVAEGKGIQTLRTDPWIPFPTLRVAGDDTRVAGKGAAIETFPMHERYAVYILASRRNGTLYIGVTGDLASRITQHKARAVPGLTRRYGVTTLVYVERYGDVNEAIAREKQLKGWNRAWKIKVIEAGNPTGPTSTRPPCSTSVSSPAGAQRRGTGSSRVTQAPGSPSRRLRRRRG